MKPESAPLNPRIETNPSFADFLPEEFTSDPLAYFREKGVNIKSGETTYDANGVIDEDPHAVKDLPAWTNAAGETLFTVAKKVNTEKAQIQKQADPFYEYRVMEILQKIGLPAPRPIAKIEQSGVYLIIMERVAGIRWVNNDIRFLKDKGYTAEDLARLEAEANEMMLALSARYEAAGIIRKWKLRDMVFDIDIDQKKLRSMTPVDWERTKLDMDK